MAKIDSLQEAIAGVSAAARAAGFKNSMKKYNLAAEFEKRGIDVTVFDATDNDRLA